MAEGKKKDPQKKLALVAKATSSRLGMPQSLMGPGLNRAPLIAPQLRETRAIRIGKKDSEVRQGAGGVKWRRPVKLDYFLCTKPLKDEKDDFVVDHAFHEKFGAKPTEIPIKLLFDNIPQQLLIYLGLYKGRKAWCRGDGEKASRLQTDGSYKKIECPCDLLRTRQCKYHIVFHFRLPGMAIGECAKFRSTGKHSMAYIQAGLVAVKQSVSDEVGCSFEDAPLKNIQMVMRLQKETVSGPDGKMYVIPSVHVAYQGTEQELGKVVEKRLKARKTTRQELLKLDAMRFQLLLQDESAEEAREISEEFHPEVADDDPTKVIDGQATVKTKIEPDAKAEAAADRIDKASKEARAQMPPGIQRALEADDGPEDSDPAKGDVDLPSRPAGEKKPKEKKDEWL